MTGSDLTAFIKNHQVETGTDFTHTYFGKNTLLLNIPFNELPTFRKLYFKHINAKKQICITEKSIKSHIQFFVDVDFKLEHFEKNIISINDVYFFMKNIKETFIQVFQECFPHMTIDCIETYRMIYKCHLFFPDIFLSFEKAKELCNEVIYRLKKDFPFIEKEKIIDTSVYSSGLRMLGSDKSGSLSNKSSEKEKHVKFFKDSVEYNTFYRVSEWVEKNNEMCLEYQEITLNHLEKATIIASKNCQLLEIYENFKPMKPKKHISRPLVMNPDIVDVNMTGETSENIDTNMTMNMNNVNNDIDVDIDINKDAGTNIISDIPAPTAFLIREYVENALGKVGVSFNNAVMKKTQFNSIQFDLEPQICKIAGRFHKRTLERNVSPLYAKISAFDSTLCCWKCTEENPEQHIVLEDPSDEIANILKSISPDYCLKRSLYLQTHETICEHIFHLLKNHFAVSPTKNGYLWYYYDTDENCWIEYEKIISEIMSENGKVQKEYTLFLKNLKSLGAKKEDLDTMNTLWKKLRRDLQTTPFVKGGLIPLLSRKFDRYWSKSGSNFQSLLNSNPKVMGFANGVWDFTKRKEEFRQGKPSDYISISTHTNYKPYNLYDIDIRNDLETFLMQIFGKKEHLDYTLQEIGKCMNGTPIQQRFFIMTGAGANGKSTLIRLLNLALGDYAGEVNITLFTHPRPPANAPTPELIQCKGKRFIACSEPNAKDSLNLGTIKWLSGGDRITAAAKHENNQSFYLQATFFCLTNDVPPINASINDFGTWRRLLPLCFNSRFVQNPNKDYLNEFATDDSINDKLELWKDAFVSLLIEYYLNSLKNSVLPVPEEYRKLWQQLQNKNDVYGRFIKECIVKNNEYFKSSKSIFHTFIEWLRALLIPKKITYDIFEKNMINLLGPLVEHEGISGWNVEIKSLPITSIFNHSN